MKKSICFIVFTFSFNLIFAQPEIVYAQSKVERDISELLNQYIEAINNGNYLMNLASSDFYRFNNDLIKKSKNKKEQIYFSRYSYKSLLEEEWSLWQPTYCCDLSSFARREIVAFEQGEKKYPKHLSFTTFIDSCNRENKSLLKSHQKKLDEQLNQLQRIVVHMIHILDSLEMYIEDKVYIQDQFNNYEEAMCFLQEAQNASEAYQLIIHDLEESVQQAYVDLLKKVNVKSTPLKKFYTIVNNHIAACKKLVVSLKKDSLGIPNQLTKVKSYIDQSPNYESYIRKNDSIVKWIRYLDVHHNKGECCLSPGFYSFNEQITSDTERFLVFFQLVNKENSSEQNYKISSDYGQMKVSLKELVQEYNHRIRTSDTPLLKLTDLFDPFYVAILKQDIADSNSGYFELENSKPINLLLLVDISASMNELEKLPLVKETIYWLSTILRSEDYLSVVTYADHPTIYLDHLNGNKESKIKKMIDPLKAGGKTNMDEAFPITLELSEKNFIQNGNNKIILITDGLFTLDAKQEQLIKSYNQKNIHVSVFYFGKKEKGEQVKVLKKISSWGRGNYYYITKKNIRSVLFNEIK